MYKFINNIRTVIIIFSASISLANNSTANDDQVINWATNSVISTYSYNALSYEKQMTDLSSLFTTKGWENFEDALKKSGNLESVKKNQLVVTAYKKGQAKIISFSKDKKNDTWVVKVPLSVTYINEYIKVDQQVESYVTITSKNDKSMLIANINSSLTEPTKTMQSIPEPRANCSMATAEID